MQARSVERSALPMPARAAERSALPIPSWEAQPPPPLPAASPPVASGSRYSVLAELESADGLAMLSQDSAEPGGGGGGGGDAVQEALSALKLGALPVVNACMPWEGVRGNLVNEVTCLADIYAVLPAHRGTDVAAPLHSGG